MPPRRLNTNPDPNQVGMEFDRIAPPGVKASYETLGEPGIVDEVDVIADAVSGLSERAKVLRITEELRNRPIAEVPESIKIKPDGDSWRRATATVRPKGVI